MNSAKHVDTLVPEREEGGVVGVKVRFAQLRKTGGEREKAGRLQHWGGEAGGRKEHNRRDSALRSARRQGQSKEQREVDAYSTTTRGGSCSKRGWASPGASV